MIDGGWFVVASPVLHGSAGIWDELACLALPLFVAVTLWILSRKPATDEEDPADDHPHHAEEEGP